MRTMRGIVASGRAVRNDCRRRATRRHPAAQQGRFGFRSGRGVVFIPDPAKYLLSIVSECAIQEESAGERGHHMYGLPTYQELAPVASPVAAGIFR